MEIILSESFAKSNICASRETAHKGNMGTLSILAGSAQYRGAATLAVFGALRAGVGRVRLVSTEKVCAAVSAHHPCCMFLPLPETNEGEMHPMGLGALLLQSPTAILAGCGMGNTQNTANIVASLVQQADVPLVLDADAINTLSGALQTGYNAQLHKNGKQLLKTAKSEIIITPHIGEMSRLAGIPTQTIIENQKEVALNFAKENGCIVVLKSHITVVGTPSGTAYINNTTGNPGMAKGGSGDVLAGIIGALVAKGMAPEIACALAVWLHSAAGKLAAKNKSSIGMLPFDIPNYLCDLWRDLEK